jgi:hypothetical protein
MCHTRPSSPQWTGPDLWSRLSESNRRPVHYERSHKHWVIPPPNEAALPSSVTDRLLANLRRRPVEALFRVGRPMYAQEFYHVEGWTPPVGPELSAVDSMDAAPIVEDHEAYYRYRRVGISGEEVVQVPAVLRSC